MWITESLVKGWPRGLEAGDLARVEGGRGAKTRRLTGARCDAATQRRARFVREDVIDGRRV
jgi:hypothetical protein